jgi:murein DD-endopeptidase MepM/ murein hydrolase activator NlpD
MRMPNIVIAFLGLLAGGPCWSPPVDALVSDPYRAPACSYCPGNRGIEYAPVAGQPVTAVQAGTVTFAAAVAGTRYVVIDHGDGIRATYGRMATVTVSRGQSVRPGDRLGTTTSGFYFGLRRGVAPGDVPVDPTPMLGVRRYPPRLVPLDGTPRPVVGPGRLVCRNQAGGR